MNPTLPGNEPDPGDMSTEPDAGGSPNSDLPDDDAEQLGDFA